MGWVLVLVALGFLAFFWVLYGLAKASAPDNPVDRAVEDQQQVDWLEWQRTQRKIDPGF